MYYGNSARYVPYLSKRKTVDGIWFLILIVYVYTADTCLNLLRCVQVYEPIEFKGKRVSMYYRILGNFQIIKFIKWLNTYQAF